MLDEPLGFSDIIAADGFDAHFLKFLANRVAIGFDVVNNDYLTHL